MNRYSSRTSRLDEQFLNEKLRGAVSYDRMGIDRMLRKYRLISTL